MLLFSFSCKSQSNELKKEAKDSTSAKEEPVEKLYNPTLSIVKDDYTLKDSASFYELVNYIIDNAEMNTSTPHELTDGSISFRVYKAVYETSDDKISLTRKLDLLSLLFFYHYHAANEYQGIVSGEIVRANKKVISRPILLIPVLTATYWSEPILYTITREETIVLPESYTSSLDKTLLEINKLLNWRKINKKTFRGPLSYTFDKKFHERYLKHKR